jgi:uncharacterized protein YdiU (UPF0061 family)
MNRPVSFRMSTVFSAVVFIWTRRVQHTHVRVGFFDYRLLIHAATDNPFLLHLSRLVSYCLVIYYQSHTSYNSWQLYYQIELQM